MNNRYAIAMTEFLYLLKGFPIEDVNKIPNKVLDFFEQNKDNDYICNFDYNDSIKNIKLKNETYGILGLICYNYWCGTEEEKSNYLKILNRNEEKYQEKIRKQFDPKNLFKKNK